MNKEEIDELYHLLRRASNIRVDPTAGLTPLEEINILYGLCRHLLAGGDYAALIKFSQYYGRRFLLKPTCDAISKTGWAFTRIVEFGAGLGWLGRGVAAEFNLLPTLFIDKRPWVMIDVVADLETEKGIEVALSHLREDDLIIMCDFLHCLDAPEALVSTFQHWPIVILEYSPVDPSHRESYSIQAARYGAKPIKPENYMTMFPGRKVDVKEADPYIILLVEAAVC